MISLVKLHFSYMFSWRIIYISLITLLICLVSFVMLSNFYLNNNLLLFYSDYYTDEYIFSSLSLIKIVILLQSMFIVINGFILNKYDIYLLIRRNRTSVILSKIITIILGITIFTVFLYLLMNIIGLFLTPYYEFQSSYLNIVFDLIIFSILYSLFYILLIVTIKNMYSLLMIFIFYFISNISLEYSVTKNDLPGFTKFINLLFPDIGYFSNLGYDLFYSNFYYISLCIVIIQLILVIYKKTDITN